MKTDPRIGFFTARYLHPLGSEKKSPIGMGKVSDILRAVVHEAGPCAEVLSRNGRLEVHTPSAPSPGAWSIALREFSSGRAHLPRFRRGILDSQRLAHLVIPDAAVFVHDLFQVTHPLRQPSPDVRRSVAQSIPSTVRCLGLYPLLLAPSAYTKAMLCDHLGIPPERVRVTPLDCDRSVFRPNPEKRRATRARLGVSADRPMFLHASYNYPRKNIARILGALHRLVERRPEIVLVKVGKSPEDERMLARFPVLRNHVIFLPRMPEADLAGLFGAADCFVFPSLAEGFGLPVLEAQACGCPVVTSNTTALREIAGPLCITVDPTQEEAIADAMLKVLEDTGYRFREAAANSAWLRQFSWDPLRGAIREWVG